MVKSCRYCLNFSYSHLFPNVGGGKLLIFLIFVIVYDLIACLNIVNQEFSIVGKVFLFLSSVLEVSVKFGLAKALLALLGS